MSKSTWYTNEKLLRIFTSVTLPMYALMRAIILFVNSTTMRGEFSLLIAETKKRLSSFTGMSV